MSLPNRDEVPQYQHDCTHCTFLSRYHILGNSYDLYIHKNTSDILHRPKGTPNYTLVARHSSDPPDYESGPLIHSAFKLRSHWDPMVIAYQLAVAHKHLTDDPIDPRPIFRDADGNPQIYVVKVPPEDPPKDPNEVPEEDPNEVPEEDPNEVPEEAQQEPKEAPI